MFHVGFNPGNPTFPQTNLISQFFSNPDDKIVNKMEESNVLMIGNFVQEYEMPLIINYPGIRIMYIGEPINDFSFCKLASLLFKNNACHYYIGCISNKPGKCIKYPFYWSKTTDFKGVNDYVATCSIARKDICTLINRHDPGNTRTPITKELSKYINVVCPGKLFNNCSNEELNRIGNVEFLKKYVFNICSENFGASHPGYISEKIMNCCLGGAIPIYFGELDEIDKRVFNSDRILFLNHSNVNQIVEKVIYMLKNPDILMAFYKQPVFLNSAQDAMDEIENGIRGFFSNMSSSAV
jgi:hypothetical protein